MTNAQAQVVSVRGEAIPGLYATSNAAAHLAVGASYTSGQAHSQSMVGGYLAAKHMAGKGEKQVRG